MVKKQPALSQNENYMSIFRLQTECLLIVINKSDKNKQRIFEDTYGTNYYCRPLCAYDLNLNTPLFNNKKKGSK